MKGRTEIVREAEAAEPFVDRRKDVHAGEPSPHLDCPDPASCDCNCRTCKRAWENAGRPSPPEPAAAQEGEKPKALVAPEAAAPLAKAEAAEPKEGAR